ncbi:MAG: hypothetical protein COB02_18560 [Candidatus Cloacimonadota bacterium]|nr:MAG: hypothetical protein COB02_18560 [Candidatus Cloacimonadota bacterium]
MQLSMKIMAGLVMTGIFLTQTPCSSHREAPAITETPKVDASDFYMFKSYETGRGAYTTIIANYIPLQDPQGGPNYFSMDPHAIYEIHLDNTGDGVEDMTFQFDFTNSLSNGGVGQTLSIGGVNVSPALKHTGVISAGNNTNLGLNETYTIKMITGDRRTGTVGTVTNASNASTSFTKPYDYVGNKTFTNVAGYTAYANQYIYNVTIPGCTDTGKVFVGQRKESFVVNLGETFDLVNYTPIDSTGITQSSTNNDLAGKNVTSIAMEIPTSCIVSSEVVIGGWTTASRPQARIIRPGASGGGFGKDDVQGGAWTQVSRLGNPLVNELVIGVKDKDYFNHSEPKDDGARFAIYVTNPTFPAILNILFGAAFPAATQGIAPLNFPRNDLVATFLTGISGVNQPASFTASEILRLNTSIAATPATSQNAFGVVAGDLAGFPNGRRPGDDVVDLALRVLMGALCHPVQVDLDANGTVGNAADVLGLCTTAQAPAGTVPFTDGAPIDHTHFDNSFPYLKVPNAGSPN